MSALEDRELGLRLQGESLRLESDSVSATEDTAHLHEVINGDPSGDPGLIVKHEHLGVVGGNMNIATT